MLSLPEFSESREMFFEASLVKEHATSLHCGCAAALRESTTGSDAGVSGLKLHHHVLSVENFLKAAQDLLVKALLDLRTPCKVLHDAV